MFRRLLIPIVVLVCSVATGQEQAPKKQEERHTFVGEWSVTCITNKNISGKLTVKTGQRREGRRQIGQNPTRGREEYL